MDNRTYRLGDYMTVRLPTAVHYTPAVSKEDRWLPILAPSLPVPIPVPLAKGAPGEGYPFSWSIRRWLDGEPARPELIDDLPGFAVSVAEFHLLVRDGGLAAVIDFGTSGVGDPACDLVIAWTMFTGASREAFRDAVGQDAGTWARARGWALWKALLGLADDVDTHPGRAAVTRKVITEVLADHERAG